MSRNTFRRVALAALVLILIGTVNYLRHRPARQKRPKTTTTTTTTRPSGTSPSAALNLALGNPSNATDDAGSRDNYLIEKPQYVLSYNDGNGEANWVSWHLQSSDIGNVERQNNFHPESALPKGFTRVMPEDYTGSGYDRGHLCNSKDRSSSAEDNSETFSMANMLPQAPDLNRNVWESLESYCRSLVQQGNDLYIIAGGYGSVKRIGKGKRVSVPTNCWKIVCIVPAGGDLLSITSNTRVIAVDMPNAQGIADRSWESYTTTVRDLERKTGYDFLSKVSKEIQDVIEVKKDGGPS
jgi:endonuclease G